MRFLWDRQEIFPAGRFTAGRQPILRAVGARSEHQLYQPSGFFAPFTQLLLQVSKAIRISHDIEKFHHKNFTPRRRDSFSRCACWLLKHFTLREQCSLFSGYPADGSKAGDRGNSGLPTKAET
jgi:hypothetical protein